MKKHITNPIVQTYFLIFLKTKTLFPNKDFLVYLNLSKVIKAIININKQKIKRKLITRLA